MKRFEIITEADARVLETGSDGATGAGRPHHAARRRHAARAAHHGGARRRARDVAGRRRAPTSAAWRSAATTPASRCDGRSSTHLRGAGTGGGRDRARGHRAGRLPGHRRRRGAAVARGEADAGIVIDGAGLGLGIAANKVPGIRAAMCTDATLARYAREHNGANVLTLGATLLSTDSALAIVDTWLATPMTEPRYIRRLAKIRRLERDR